MSETYIGTANETCECPNCGKDLAIADVELIKHDTLPILIPVGHCWACGFIWSGTAAEEIVEAFAGAAHPPQGGDK